METLSNDLKALVNAKELTLQQALELNKQKKPKEEQMINLLSISLLLGTNHKQKG